MTSTHILLLQNQPSVVCMNASVFIQYNCISCCPPSKVQNVFTAIQQHIDRTQQQSSHSSRLMEAVLRHVELSSPCYMLFALIYWLPCPTSNQSIKRIDTQHTGLLIWDGPKMSHLAVVCTLCTGHKWPAKLPNSKQELPHLAATIPHTWPAYLMWHWPLLARQVLSNEKASEHVRSDVRQTWSYWISWSNKFSEGASSILCSDFHGDARTGA